MIHVKVGRTSIIPSSPAQESIQLRREFGDDGCRVRYSHSLLAQHDSPLRVLFGPKCFGGRDGELGGLLFAGGVGN